MKKFSLPAPFAREWMNKLRSGDYKQGKGYLFNKDNFCCLGVAGVVCGVDASDMDNVCAISSIFEFHEKDNPDDPLPKGVENVPDILTLEDGLTSILINMNDDEDKSFEEIADWIEENVEFVEPELNPA
jgi:hypothetical protein